MMSKQPICMCSVCDTPVFLGDALMEHKHFEFDGSLRMVELVHPPCAARYNTENSETYFVEGEFMPTTKMRPGRVREWLLAAFKDGWLLEAKSHITAIQKHTPEGTWKAHVSPEDIHVWGPDGLCIVVPVEYAWKALQAALRTCDSCKKQDVETFRYYFAGRGCAACLPALKKQYETPGWTN